MAKKTVIDRIIDSGLIEEDSYIVVGFSGGPDSLCLLHSLVQIAEPYNLTIIPVHVNHLLREAAYEEANNAIRICEKLDLDCQIFEADCQAMADDLKLSTEEAGRFLRYEIFDDQAGELAEQGIDPDKIFIAVAHNADDQSETVLFRLLRGTGVHGLAGIPRRRISEMGYEIIRPLLDVPRADIEEYIKQNRLHPNMDESNEGTEYTRNKIRNELIPYLEKNYNPNIKETLRRFAELADTDDSMLSDIAINECSENLSANSDNTALILDIEQLREAPPSINSRVIATIMETLRLQSNASYELVSLLLSQIYSDNPSASIDLPNGYKAIRDYDQIVFTCNPEVIASMAVNSEPDGALRIESKVIQAKAFNPELYGSYAAFDFDAFNAKYPGKLGEIELRPRQEGDFIAMKDGKSKKIQDFLIDSKVRKNDREAILMACIGNEVLWIPPDDRLPTEEQREKGKFSQNFHLNDTTERVLFLEVVDEL